MKNSLLEWLDSVGACYKSYNLMAYIGTKYGVPHAEEFKQLKDKNIICQCLCGKYHYNDKIFYMSYLCDGHDLVYGGYSDHVFHEKEFLW